MSIFRYLKEPKAPLNWRFVGYPIIIGLGMALVALFSGPLAKLALVLALLKVLIP